MHAQRSLAPPRGRPTNLRPARGAARRSSHRLGAALAAVLLGLVLPLAGAVPAQAATSGSITELSAKPTDLPVGGGAGSLRIGWSFPNGSAANDTVTLSIPAGFALTSLTPQVLRSEGGLPLAEFSFDETTVTIKRLVGAEYGGISSAGAPVEPRFTLDDPQLTDGREIAYTWNSSDPGNPAPTTVFTGRASGEPNSPSWYTSNKSV